MVLCVQARGEEKLRSMKCKGRPGAAVKKPRTEADMDSLLEPGRTEYPRDEIKSVKRELARLRCREELPEKFEALAQEYPIRRNGC